MIAPQDAATPRRTRAAAALVAGLLPLALTACGASRDAQTYQERNSADASNTAVGALALRGITVLPPRSGGAFQPGEDAEAVLTVTNADDEADTLVEVSTPAATSVEVLNAGRPATLEVPPLGSTANAVTLRLVGLTARLREGEYVPMTFRFARNGTVEVAVPVAVSGKTDRPVYTGEEGGEEGEPALQGPAGGHSEEDHSGEGGDSREGDESGAEGDTADLSEPEQGAQTGDTAEGTDEPAEGASTTDGAEPASSPATE